MISSCSPHQQNSTNTTATENKATLDLAGEWIQTNSADDSFMHAATISNSEIEIYWLDSKEDTKSLYWSGSYVPPANNDKKYEWDSVNNKEKTDGALLASSDETKHFIYENGQISYEASAMGTTKTIKLKRNK